MTVTDRRGQPLPANHPFKGGLIVFGGRKPVPPASQPETNLDQIEHDKRMASQTPAQRAAMVRGLGKLARAKLGEPGEGNA